jgi:hypothetical protein
MTSILSSRTGKPSLELSLPILPPVNHPIPVHHPGPVNQFQSVNRPRAAIPWRTDHFPTGSRGEGPGSNNNGALVVVGGGGGMREKECELVWDRVGTLGIRSCFFCFPTMQWSPKPNRRSATQLCNGAHLCQQPM